MTENVTDDPEFWMNAGLDYIHRTWRNHQLISLDDMTALGKVFVQQGPDAAKPHAADIEKKYPGLMRK